MQLKMDPSKGPTFNYFIRKINTNLGQDSTELRETYKLGMDYIKEHYPKAKPGNNYWLQADQAPLADQYFLRCYTYRSCFPPYIDRELNFFEKEVEAFIRKEAELEVELASASEPAVLGAVI